MFRKTSPLCEEQQPFLIQLSTALCFLEERSEMEGCLLQVCPSLGSPPQSTRTSYLVAFKVLFTFPSTILITSHYS